MSGSSHERLDDNHSKPIDVQSLFITVSSMLLIVVGGVSILSAMYSKWGFKVRHGVHKRSLSGVCSYSSWPEANDEYQLLSLTTLTSIMEDDTAPIRSIDRRTKKIFPSHYAYPLYRPQQSLPNSPQLSANQALRTNLYVLKRSSTTSPKGFRQLDRLDWKINQRTSKCSANSLSVWLFNQPSKVVEDLEMSAMNPTGSEVTLKEEKVLNTTTFAQVPPPSSHDNDTSLTKSSVSFTTASMSDQEFELDYYDLDVRNAGDVPDSFLRCLTDDSVYWDNNLVNVLEDIKGINSTSVRLEVFFLILRAKMHLFNTLTFP